MPTTLIGLPRLNNRVLHSYHEPSRYSTASTRPDSCSMTRFNIRLAGWALIACSVLVGIIAAPLARSQNPVPTDQQLEIFKNLPKDQQDAILQGMGRPGSSSTAAKSGRTSSPQTVQPAGNQGPDASNRIPKDVTSDGRTLRNRDEDPELRPGDSVLVEIDLKIDANPRLQRGAGPGGPNQLGQAAAGQGQAGVPAAANGATPDTGSMANLIGGQRVPPARKLTDDEEKKLRDTREKIVKGNPYRLNRFGIIEIPGLQAMPMAGLTSDEATNMLAADPGLADFDVKITLLRLQHFDDESLKPFGYDLFAGAPSTFAPVTDIPVPGNYIVGADDSLEIQLYGNTTATYTLTVSRDGTISLPKLGPVLVGGMSFDDARARIESLVRRQMIGTRASVMMGDLRTIRVFVLGEAERPGSYTVSGLSTMTNALFVSGGVKPIGSLRHIQLKRAGRLVSELDLYQLLLQGDTSADRKLLPGDVIFIPPIGETVAVNGEVRRPAVYELKDEKSVDDVLRVAGGMTPEADPSLISIERITKSGHRITRSFNLSTASALEREMANGDRVHVQRIRPTLERSVQLQGFVFRRGTFEYRDGMRLSDVLGSFDELRPNADRHYIMITRQVPPEQKLQVVSADLEEALKHRGSDADTPLQARDVITVFDLTNDRQRVVEPLLKSLEVQGTAGDPPQIVSVGGSVKAPGRYPLEPNMRVSDLIRAGGSLEDDAYGGEAELTRYEVSKGQMRQTELLKIDLAAVRHGDATANFALRPYDNLIIKETPAWEEQATVEVSGEVRFPGRYPILRGETLHSVLQRAGGLTDLSFPEGAVFTRETLKEREKAQIELLSNRFQSDLTSLSLQALANTNSNSATASQALLVGQQLIGELRDTKPVGRLVIDIRQVLSGPVGGQSDVLVKDGDKLMVPKETQEITVIGEVQSPTSHVMVPGLTRDDYIAKSGGVTQKADVKRIYVVKANGSVMSNERRGWFRRGTRVAMEPGDTIVVPLDAERIRPLPLWTAVTTIIYNLAVAVAAISRF